MKRDVRWRDVKRRRGTLALSDLSAAFTSSRDRPTRSGTSASAYSLGG